MFKKLLFAALLVASFSAKAQIVTSKCGCTLQKWEYTRTDSSEILVSPDVNTWVELDWKNSKAKVKGGDTYPLTGGSSAFEPKTIAHYGGQTVTIFFDNKNQYIGHETKEN